LVANFHPQEAVLQVDANGELTAGLAGSAVDDGVGDQLGQAEDRVVGHRAAVQYDGQKPARLSHLSGNGREGTRPHEQRCGCGLAHVFSRSVVT
jgi:hypothetical protein